MTCKEAESMVMPYINEELTDRELASFLEHIYGCKACYEELEIYYTLYMGLAQLDGVSEERDMHNILQEALRASETHIRARRMFHIYYAVIQVLAMAALIVMIIMEIIRL